MEIIFSDKYDFNAAEEITHLRTRIAALTAPPSEAEIKEVADAVNSTIRYYDIEPVRFLFAGCLDERGEELAEKFAKSAIEAFMKARGV